MATIEIATEGTVSEIVLNRPEKKNSLREEDFRALSAAVEEVSSSPARAVLIRGAGGAFSAGRDIGGVDPMKEDSETLIRTVINPVFHAIRAIPVPTIAAVEGPCLGAGLGVGLSCDIVLAAENAVFGSPFRAIGCILDSGGHHFLRERLGPHRAAELIFTGRLISGSEAAEIGLVNRAYGAVDLLGQARAMARMIAEGPTEAFRISKTILQSPGDFDALLDLEAVGQAKAVRTDDGREGFRAFQEKRRPRFTGS